MFCCGVAGGNTRAALGGPLERGCDQKESQTTKAAAQQQLHTMGFSGGQFALLALALGIGLIYALVTMNQIRGTVDNIGLQVQELQDQRQPKAVTDATDETPEETPEETPDVPGDGTPGDVAPGGDELPMDGGPAGPQPPAVAPQGREPAVLRHNPTEPSPPLTVVAATVAVLPDDGGTITTVAPEPNSGAVEATFTPPATAARSTRSRGRKLGSKVAATVAT